MSRQVFDERAYHMAYMRKRRARDRAAGMCVNCTTRPAKRGLARNGARYTHCERCIEKKAPRVTAMLRRRLRHGFCRSCPRRRPRGDRRQECPRCRAKKCRRDQVRRQQLGRAA